MKYIVVYTILILGFTSVKTAAQKTSIDLLPSANEGFHHEAMIDTCVTPDSLFHFDSIAPEPDAGLKATSESPSTGEHAPAIKRRSVRALALMVKPGLNSPHIKNFNPIQFIIHFTALKF